MAWLKQKLFGSSSERRKDEFPGQMSLFDAEEEKPLELIEPEVVELPKKPRKKKPTLKEQFANIPTRQVMVDTLSDDIKSVLSVELRFQSALRSSVVRLSTQDLRLNESNISLLLTVVRNVKIRKNHSL